MTRLAMFLAVSLALGTPAAAGDWRPLVTPAEAAELMAADAVVIDIRSVKDYAQGHLETAVNVPYHAWRGPEDNPGELIDDVESARARWQAESMLVNRQAAQAQRLSLQVDRYLQQVYSEMIDWDDRREQTPAHTPLRRPPRTSRVGAALEQAEAGRLQADLRIFRPRRAA